MVFPRFTHGVSHVLPTAFPTREAGLEASMQGIFRGCAHTPPRSVWAAFNRLSSKKNGALGER
jgi:hypothetical protein